ncbi:MAG: cupin domain-containing protein [Planctomycetota bacterium]|jgi:mannose-6-phosphate isomerase-like protein (cupin superfamily)|nr:cupin domain-containing protein [Planctomycetota bacterium]
MRESKLEPFEFIEFQKIPGVPCPCGTAKRGLEDAPDFPGTVHLTEISVDAEKHFHKEHAEVYFFLHCESGAKMELNDEIYTVRAGDCVLIRPGTVHRAVGKMTVLIISMPKFDPKDEYVVGHCT